MSDEPAEDAGGGVVHVVAGDAHVARLEAWLVGEGHDCPVGRVVPLREALADGPVPALDDHDAWLAVRRAHLGLDQGNSDPTTPTDLLQLARDAGVLVLWFDGDLFCQANLWMALTVLLALPDDARPWTWVAGAPDHVAWGSSLDPRWDARVEVRQESLVSAAFALDLLRASAGQSAGEGESVSFGHVARALDEMPDSAFGMVTANRWPGFATALEALAARDTARAAGVPDAISTDALALLAAAPVGTMPFAELLAAWGQAEPRWGFGDTQLWAMLRAADGAVTDDEGAPLGPAVDHAATLRITDAGRAALVDAALLLGE